MDQFELLEEALALQREGEHPNDEHDDQTVVSCLENGDFHVCRRNTCKFAYFDPDTKMSVCRITGLTWGHQLVEENSATWTGRSSSSNNPDILAGVPVGGWKSRRDVFSESKRAYDVASFIVSESVPCAETREEMNTRQKRATSRRDSRGARCVDDLDQNYTIKKPRVVREKLDGVHVADRLKADAGNVLNKLTQPLAETHAAKAAAIKHIDPRFTDLRLVTHIALKKWALRVAQGTDRLDTSRIHDVLVAANEFVRQKREEVDSMKNMSTVTGKRRRVAFDGVLKSSFANLIVALWRACATTPYLSYSRRGGDSFRPFVSGIAYSLKRGVRCSLLNGAYIVPCLPEISEDLPTLRSADVSHQARQLQSQSHRGICALSRSISSVEDLRRSGTDNGMLSTCMQEFQTASVVCQQFIQFVKSR